MMESFELVERHLYRRRYQTSSGEWATCYVGRFVDWKGVRRKFPLGEHLDRARNKLGELRKKNDAEFDFDKEKAEKKKAKASGMTLFPWIERFMSVKASKRSLSKDKESAQKRKFASRTAS